MHLGLVVAALGQRTGIWDLGLGRVWGRTNLGRLDADGFNRLGLFKMIQYLGIRGQTWQVPGNDLACALAIAPLWISSPTVLGLSVIKMVAPQTKHGQTSRPNITGPLDCGCTFSDGWLTMFDCSCIQIEVSFIIRMELLPRG